MDELTSSHTNPLLTEKFEGDLETGFKSDGSQLEKEIKLPSLPKPILAKSYSDSSIKPATTPLFPIVDPVPLKRNASAPITTQPTQTENSTSLNKKISGFLKRSSSFKSGSLKHTSSSTIPTFYCEICLENCAQSLGFQPSQCASQHTYCNTCLEGWCTTQITDGCVSLTCPGFSKCQGRFIDEEVQRLVSESDFSKYSRFQRVKGDPDFRECPQCGLGASYPPPSPLSPALPKACDPKWCVYPNVRCQGRSLEVLASSLPRPTPLPNSTVLALTESSEPEELDEDAKVISPGAPIEESRVSEVSTPVGLSAESGQSVPCSFIFCVDHSNAHPGVLCSEYSTQLGRRVKAEMQASESLVKRMTKPCPSCKAGTEKNGGCNHMTCQNCRADWCWLCGKQLTNVSDHYSPTNFLGCPGAQFASEDPLSTCGRYFGCLQILPVACATISLMGLGLFLVGLGMGICFPIFGTGTAIYYCIKGEGKSLSFHQFWRDIVSNTLSLYFGALLAILVVGSLLLAIEIAWLPFFFLSIPFLLIYVLVSIIRGRNSDMKELFCVMGFYPMAAMNEYLNETGFFGS